ncbi:iron chaperone [Primorskyibacter sp. 2E107]|uniref:iron chaperone n=1 Tax=Primorskyibacter sp. 2E107 TaxID=3403458 RepID=UPI003AF4F2AF
MLRNAETPSEFLNMLDDDWRRDILKEIRALIKSKAPQLAERIHYKMLGYGIDDAYAFHLNAQRAYVSLYVGNVSKVDPNGELLDGLNVGKGCIRFSKTTKIKDTRIDEFIARAFAMWQAGEDVDC